MLPRLVIAFLPRSKCLLISWLQSPSTVILAPKKIKILFYLLRWNQDPAQSLHYCSGCSLLSLNPLLSLISNCLNLTFGTQGRSWRLEAGVCSPQTRNKRHGKASMPRISRGSCLVSLSYYNQTDGQLSRGKNNGIVVYSGQLVVSRFRLKRPVTFYIIHLQQALTENKVCGRMNGDQLHGQKMGRGIP